jgi:hypothetical protein
VSSPSNPFLLATGVTVRVEPPGVPALRMAPPTSTTVTVLPVPGPPGPKGDPGDSDVTNLIAVVAANQAAVAALQNEPRGFVATISQPAQLVQVVHGLPFLPAGVRCRDPQGLVEPADITHPAPGVTEVTFGTPFTGTITVS